MAYQIKKTHRITEDVEFLGENGEVELTVKLDIDVERIAGDFRKAQIAVMNAEKAAKEKQTDEMLETYGKAIVEFIRLIFGDENTQKLIKYFDNRYIDMLFQTMPFIYDVVVPSIEKSVRQKKQLIANNNTFSRKQRRKLGLK